MEFRLLGPLEVEEGGRLLPVGGAKQRALLTVLLLHAGQVVSRDRLIEDVWGDREPGTAGHSLEHQISRLRKSLESADVIETRPGGYLLRVGPGQIDTQRFERLLDEGRRARAAGHPDDAVRLLVDALGLWRGPALADVAYESFARTEAERLEELRVVAIEERIDADLALGQDASLVPELDALIAAHPLRERLRGQLMLALYRSGRQAEALHVYAETRTLLVEELGLEPGQPLRELEHAILEQDPALNRPASAVGPRRRRRRVWAVGAIAAAGAIVTAAVLFATGGTQSSHAQSLIEPDTDAFLAASTGKVVRVGAAPSALKVRFGFGSLWSISQDGELTRIDPTTGGILATLGLGITPSGLATGAGSVWVTDANSRTVIRIDPTLNVKAQAIGLPKAGTDQTSDVVVADGSVWVGHGGYNPGTYVDRFSPSGHLLHRFSILGGEATALAFADGALWVASSPAGVLWKIDPATNTIQRKVQLKQGVCCVAAGGGYVWAAVDPDSTIWKLDQDGNVLGTVKLPAQIVSLSFGDGALWATDGAGGSVFRIDPTTNARRRYALGHDLTGIDVRNGLVAVGVLPTATDATAGLTGRIVRVALAKNSLFWSGAPTDPALYASWDAPQLEFAYATCGRLLTYRDVEGEAGKQVVPDIAAAMPAVTNGGRTYTFHIRRGYGFSPPSHEAVTAASFRRMFERIFSPKLFPGSDFGPYLIEGLAAFRAGKAPGISGISADGDSLVIRFVRPVPELPRLLAEAPYCAVPVTTPVLAHGIETPVASAGPYYLRALTPTAAVLKPNPNYHGPRPQHLDAIVYRFGVSPADAAAQIALGKLDYVMEYDPALAPDTAVARSAGSRYRLTPDATAKVQFLQFNTARPLFADRKRRLAVQYALNRTALAALDTALPATRLLSPRLPGFDSKPSYPFSPDLAKARELLGGQRFHAVIATFDADPHDAAFARLVRQQLAAVGIATTILPLTNADYSDGGLAQKTARSDLVWGGGNVNNGDPVEYLESIGLPPRESAALSRIAKLSSPQRDVEAAALASKIDRESLYAVYEDAAVPELVSRRLGCVVNQPEYAGVDLAALCLRSGARG
jgi:DNA-binding SARP family transcriptional activator/ABC-type transport system substrate-binding protein/streptogramin lyase